MADSPPRSGTPDSPSGDDLDAAQAVEDGPEPEPAPAPFGGARPWWSVEIGDGTGPHGLVNGTGPQAVPFPRDGTGPFALPRNGTGPHAMPVSANGSGPLPVVGGTGPLPRMPAAPAGPGGRLHRPLLAACAVAVAGVVIAAGVFALRARGGGGDTGTATGPGPSRKVISAGAAAGGLHKDPLTAPQASAAYPFVAGAVEAGGVPVAKNGLAVYSEEPVRPVNVLFVGGTGRISDPAGFLQQTQPSTFIAGQDADPGRKGGKAVCGTFAVLAETHTYCAWATKDSFGVVASNMPSVNPQFPLMADLMHRIRRDVEKPR
ncbi:hypothetical protein GWI34_17365 [Actinomadura sp. DSM 109109]|nr:hypothetical protein [Actinomadura lepetitiana]